MVDTIRSASRRGVLKAGLAGAAGLAALASARPARADTLAEVKKRGELVVATEMEFAPFDFLVNKEYTGVNRDLIDQVGKDLGVKVSYLDLPWTSVLPGLEAKKFDFVIAPVTITAERLKRYSFTVPIAEATVALMKRKGDNSINKPEDIAGKTVGAQKGTAQLAQLQEFSKTLPKPVTIKEYVDNNQSYADLAAGRNDAAVGSYPNLAFAAAQRADTFAMVLPPFGKPSYFSWVGRLGDEDKSLTEAISASLLKMQDDGRMAAIQKKWFGAASPLPRTVPVPQV
jgi:polar amino acid transport system substrate-binding protein